MPSPPLPPCILFVLASEMRIRVLFERTPFDAAKCHFEVITLLEYSIQYKNEKQLLCVYVTWHGKR